MIPPIIKKTPESYALSLMDSLFTDEEMKNHLLVKKKRSRSTREPLDPEQVKQLFGMINYFAVS